jgi:hypothetical protein
VQELSTSIFACTRDSKVTATCTSVISLCALAALVANSTREAFNDIYLNLSRKSGATRFSDSGFGWKPTNGETYTCDQSQIISAQWSRAARGYEVKILSRNDGVIQLDGFKPDDFDRVTKVFKTWYGINLDSREHALRGWNWGKTDFGKAELTFNVANRPAFEVPYTEVSNTNLAGKNEVAVDFSLPANSDAGANEVKNRLVLEISWLRCAFTFLVSQLRKRAKKTAKTLLGPKTAIARSRMLQIFSMRLSWTRLRLVKSLATHSPLS